MRQNDFVQRLKSLPVADRWLLGLCVLPLVYFVWIVYGFGEVQFHYAMQGDGIPLDRSFFYHLLVVLLVGYRVSVPLVGALKQRGRMPRLLFWLWLFVLLESIGAALNYMCLIDMPQEGFRWASEVHLVLRLLPFDVPEGYWIGILRLALWLAIAVLFVRKCRRLKKAGQRPQSITA